MIKTYNTQTEYENATPSSTESTLSYIKENNEAKIDGVMVVTESPKKGDICVLDTNNEIHYYSLESFDLTKLPAGWTAVGFVEWVRGGKVKVDRVLGSYPYAKYFLYELTGYIADGASHAFSVTANSATCSGNYSGTTIAQIAASMNAVVGSFDFNGHQFHIYERNGKLILQHDTYNTMIWDVSVSGMSATMVTAEEIPATPYMPRKNGQKYGEGAVASLQRALIYFSQDINSSAYNPTSPVTTLQITYPICLPGYLGTSAYSGGDQCAFLRAYYGEGEEGWYNFMTKGMEAWYPSLQGVFDEYVYGDGHKDTYLLAGQKAEAHDGSEDVLYPAFDAAAGVSFAHPDLASGKWYLGTIGEAIELVKDLTYPAKYVVGTGVVSVSISDADVLSLACYKLGMSQIANSSNVWSCSRFNAYLGWTCDGYGGYAYYGYFYVWLMVVASVLLTLPKAD